MSDYNETEDWFEQKKPTAEVLFSRFETIREQSKTRIDIDRFHCSLYYDRAYQGFGDGRSLEELTSEMFDQRRLNENVILRIVSTLAAKFAKQRTTPAMLTDMGDWAMQRRVDKYGRFLQGVLHEVDIYERQRGSDLHNIICGTGFLYAYSRKSKVKVEYVPPWEVFVDTADGRRGEPQTLYRRQLIAKSQLQKLYPKHKDKIAAVSSSNMRDAFDYFGRSDVDVVEVVTGWHLPSDEDADDGRVMVAIDGLILDEGEWDRPRFPFAEARYMLAPDGYWGIGVVAQLVGMQVELNRTLLTRQTALEMLSAPFIAVERGSNIVKTHISNLMGRILEYTGNPPQVVAPGTINPEQFNHGDRVKSSMFQNSGVSELAAASMKPAGIDSGKALRTYADMMDDALHDALTRRDRQILTISEVILDEIESIAKREEGYRAKYVGPFGVERIEFKDIEADRDAIVLKVKSSSALSLSLSGKIEDVEDLQGIGVQFEEGEVEQMLNIPDLSESRERRFSMPNLLREVIEVWMLDEGRYTAPEPRWDLNRALNIVSQTILRAQLGNAPADRIELLRKFELECMTLLAKANPPPPPPPPPDGSVANPDAALSGMPPEMQPGMQPAPEAAMGVPPSPIGDGAMPPEQPMM